MTLDVALAELLFDLLVGVLLGGRRIIEGLGLRLAACPEPAETDRDADARDGDFPLCGAVNYAEQS